MAAPRRKFEYIPIRHIKPEHSGSEALKYFKLERLIGGNPINIKHEYNTQKPKHTKFYEGGMVIREGKMGSLGTAEFRELTTEEVSNYLSAFRENTKTDEIKNKLAGIRRIIMFSGVESNVEKIGIATQLVRRREKIARMRGVDAVFCIIHNEKMESILRKEKWTCLFSNRWIKFLK